MPTDAESPEVPMVDLRGLDPPEPLVRILSSLEGEGPLRFLLSRDPLPLYAMLKVEGWRFSVRRRPEGVEITLLRPSSRAHKPS
jgi:hypothetical protein